MAAGDVANNDEEDLGPVNQPKQLDTISIIDFKDIRKGKRIGKGGCAEVYEGDWKGTRVALKETHFATVEDAERVDSLITEEIALHATIRHPNVLSFYGITKDNGGMPSVIMITELMDTDLGKRIYGKRKAISFATKVFIAKEIVKGIEHLHNRKVVHGDIKPQNILMSNDGKSVKVCDFGLSRVKESVRATQADHSVPGTIVYMSPEGLMSDVKSNFATDVWALGATLCELFTGTDFWPIPKDARRAAHLGKNIKKQRQSQTMPPGMAALKKMNNSVYTAVEGSICYVPELRDNVEQLRLKLESLSNAQ